MHEVALLDLFGITVDSLRAAGGIIVLLIGLHMLSNNPAHRHTPAEVADAKARASIGVVPLAIPIVAGPGTMAASTLAASSRSWPALIRRCSRSSHQSAPCPTSTPASSRLTNRLIPRRAPMERIQPRPVNK